MVKETVKKAKLLRSWGVAEGVTAAAKQLSVAVLGFFMARTSLVGGGLPLGAAFAAGASKKYIFSAALGSLLGYLFPSEGFSALKYSAVLLAVVAIRLLTVGLKGVAKSAIWSAVTAIAVVTGVNLVAVGSEVMQRTVAGVAEGLIAGCAAYFFRKAAEAKPRAVGNTPEQTAALLISVSLILAALYAVSFDGVSLGRIAAFVLILLSARYGRVGVGAVAGVASALAVVIIGGSASQALVFCVVGLVSGAFASVKKLWFAAVPSAVALMWVLVTSATGGSVQMLIETVSAGLIFAAIPKTVTAGFGTAISPSVVTPDSKGLRRALTLRLGFASAALHGVSDTVEDVARCLAISQRPNFAEVLSKTENDVCKGCTLHQYCWERQRSSTVDAVLGMSDAVRKCRPISMADIPAEFSERCLRIERFEDALSHNYTDFLSELAAERRVTEMREAVSNQMNGIADMLAELAEEFKTAQKYDIAMAGRVAAALKELDLNAGECSCVVDRFGRMTVEVRLPEAPEMPINRARILERLEQICERDFEPPEINRVGRAYYITATEKAVLSVDCACTQFCQGQNRHCGDTCRYFFDGRGRLVALVSDGMGSGGRAAVDSAMTAGLAERLIKAGFGYDCTLRLVNSAMLYKSTDESLATLDISCIDLFTGKTEMLKAGAAPTIVRRNGRTGRAECRSLPAGILNEVGFDRAVVTLSEGDVLIMMSDGVCTDGTDWVCAEVEAFEGNGAKQLAERIATSARRRRHDGHDDDITVFAAVIEKAV